MACLDVGVTCKLLCVDYVYFHHFEASIICFPASRVWTTRDIMCADNWGSNIANNNQSTLSFIIVASESTCTHLG